MVYTFKCTTNDGYTIKILSELLQHCLKSACFEIDETGIKLSTVDSHQKLLIDLFLKHESFIEYRCTKKMIVGINVSHLYRMLKSIKKKDSITLFFDTEHEGSLGIRVPSNKTSRLSTSFVKIQKQQYIKIKLPEGYRKGIVINSSEYQKMSKDMNTIGKTIHVYSTGPDLIKFWCTGGDLYSREVCFGGSKEEVFEDDATAKDLDEYKADFYTQQLTQLMKVAGLSTHMHIHATRGLPLMFKLNIGTLGDIKIYIKSKQQVEAQKKHRDYSDSEEEYSDEDQSEEEHEANSEEEQNNSAEEEAEEVAKRKPPAKKKAPVKKRVPPKRGRKKKVVEESESDSN